MPVLRFIRRHVLALVVVVIAVTGVAGWSLSRQSTDVDARLTTPGEVPYPQLGTNDAVVGKAWPDITVLAEGGETVSASTWTGRPLVVNFWYSTCEPCRREMPLLAETARTYSDAVTFIGVNMNDSVEVAREFADRYGVAYELFFDIDGELARELGVATAPVTLFIDPSGVIVDQFAGELEEADLVDRLRQWFSL